MKDDLLQKDKIDNKRKLIELKQNVIDFRGKTIPELEGIHIHNFMLHKFKALIVNLWHT